MKKLILELALSSFGPSMAFTASNAGQCVYPKNIVGVNGSLNFKQPIVILSQPDESGNKSVLKTFSSFTVDAETNGYIQLVTVPDYDAADPDQGGRQDFWMGKAQRL